MLRKLTTAALALALGAGAALGVAACGEQRGDVKFEGGASTTSGTGTSGTAATSTAGTVETEIPKTTTTSP